MAKRSRNSYRRGRGLDNQYDFSQISEQDFPDFVTLAKRLNQGETTMMGLNDRDIQLFLDVAMNSDPKTLQMLTEIGKKQGIEPDKMTQLIEEGRKQLASPANRQRLLDVSKKRDMANKTTAFSNAVGVLLSGADLAQSVKQLREFNRLSKEAKRPTRPGPLQADPYLDAAKKAAERGTFQESIAAKAGRQQAFDAYQQDLQNARVGSTGQAGAYGALGQVATTRLGRRGAEMAPQIEQIRQGRQQQYGQMAQLSAAENQARYNSLASMYAPDMEQYQAEQQSLAALGQAGRQNLRTSMYEMGQYAPLMARPFVNRKYENLRSALESRGMNPQQAEQFAQAGSGVSVPTITPGANQARIMAGPQAAPIEPSNNRMLLRGMQPPVVNPVYPTMASPADIAPGMPYATQALPSQYDPEADRRRRNLMYKINVPTDYPSYL